MNFTRFASIILVLAACERSDQTSETKHIMENGLRRDATVDEAKSVVQLDGGCTAFFIKNEAGLPLLGTARHCFAYEEEIEGWCAAEGAFHDYAGNIGTCEKVIATDPRYDFVVFQAKYEHPIERPLNLTTYSPPQGTPLQLIGFPADTARRGNATTSENCEITSDIPGEGQLVMSYEDLTLGHNCSTWGGNSGGPMVIEGTMDVIGLPRSYMRSYLLWTTSGAPDGRLAELDMVRTLIDLHRAIFEEYKVSIHHHPIFSEEIPVRRELSPAEQAFAQECFTQRNGEAYKALLGLTKTTSCPAAAQRLSQVSELALPGKGLRNLDFLKTGIFDRNLRALYIQDNDLTTLDGIQTLNQLKILDASLYQKGSSRIESIEPLSGTKVTHLYLSQTGFKNVEQLALVPELMELRISGNGIESLEGLRRVRLPSLQTLYIDGNALTSLKGIEAVPQLFTLVASNNALTDISSLRFLKYLQGLWLADNQLSDVAAIFKLTSLSVVNLIGNKINGELELKDVYALSRIYLSKNSIKSLRVQNMPELSDLIINDNGLEHLFIMRSPNLTTLTLDGHAVANLDGISPSSLSALTYLSARDGLSLRDISVLEYAPYLTFIDISNTSVDNLSVLRDKMLTTGRFDGIPLGTTIAKTEENCPTNAISEELRNFCFLP